MTTPVAATKLVPAEIHTDVEPEQLLKKVADSAIFVSDVLVGNGEVPQKGTKLTRFEEFRRHGVLGYATTVATESAKLTGTLWATGLTAFSPINWLNPVQWSVQLVSLPYWLTTAQIGEETWGKMAAGPVASVSGVILGTARAAGQRLRELEADYFPSTDETKSPGNPLPPVKTQPEAEPSA